MIEPNKIYTNVINLLDSNAARYKLFSHKPAFTYEELAEVQKETGFHGTEMKCIVLKDDAEFFVYVTLQGRRVDMKAVQKERQSKKVRLANPDELQEYFGAQPGCAYPFGFDAQYDIYIDPEIFSQEWVVFSPVFPDKTVQAKGVDLKKVFESIENTTKAISFNQ